MKTMKYILSSLAIVAALSSCVKDLDVTPIDPNLQTTDKALTSAADFEALLAGVYTGYAVSGIYGPGGNPTLSGIDGGMQQYIRSMFHICELPTDVYVCGWNDEGVPQTCKMQWDASTGVIYLAYCRMLFQVAHCNEFIREAKATSVDLPKKDEWIAEARALRAMSYYHAIDNFGNVAFADETDLVGKTPKRKTRAELYEWLETELRDIIDNSALPEARAGQYGRIDKGAVKMILAKLYLNAEVYTGTAQWAKCADVLKDLMDDGYSLHRAPRGTIFNAYQDLFLADNDQCTDEIIFAIEQDGNDTQSYGVTNYLVFAFTGGTMDPSALGISSGWAGCRATPEFYHKFAAGDARALFWTDGQTEDVEDFGEFTNGIGFQKYRNINADGTAGKSAGFVDIDFPMFRYADVLLMAAECEAHGAAVDGYAGFNDVRARAGLTPIAAPTLQEILDERARELYLELWRRQDLIRADQFTTNKYIWQWKGGEHDGKAVADYLNLYPIPNSDMMVNPNLIQNEGY